MERVIRSREEHAIEKHFQFRELGCTNSKADAFQYDDLNFPLRIANEPIKGRGRRNKWRGAGLAAQRELETLFYGKQTLVARVCRLRTRQQCRSKPKGGMKYMGRWEVKNDMSSYDDFLLRFIGFQMDLLRNIEIVSYSNLFSPSITSRYFPVALHFHAIFTESYN